MGNNKAAGTVWNILKTETVPPLLQDISSWTLSCETWGIMSYWTNYSSQVHKNLKHVFVIFG